MKALLQFFGLLLGLFGTLSGGYTIAFGLGLVNPLVEPNSMLVIYGVGYLISGAAFISLFFTVAEVLNRLERLEISLER